MDARYIALGTLIVAIGCMPVATVETSTPTTGYPPVSLPTNSDGAETKLVIPSLVVGKNSSGGVEVAVGFAIEPGWHIYWTNPGESGLATTVVVADNVQHTDVLYPGPQRFYAAGQIESFGYHNEAVLFIPLNRGDMPERHQALGPLHVEATWLVCKDVCIRGQAVLRSEKTATVAAFESRIQTIRDTVPANLQPNQAPPYTATWAHDEKTLTLFALPTEGETIEYFPLPRSSAQIAQQAGDGSNITITTSPPADSAGSVPQGVIAIHAKDGSTRFYNFLVPMGPTHKAVSP